MNENMETYDVFIWDEDEDDSWLWGTVHKTKPELNALIERLKAQYNADVWAYLA